MAGNRVLLVYSHYSSFVRNDHDILAREYEVERFQLGWHERLRDRVRETHLALRRAIRRNDQVFWWFFSDYAATGTMLARLAGRRFVGVAGGWDVAREPEVGYGRLLAGPVSWAGTSLALRGADVVLTVSPLNHEETLRLRPKGATILIPNGVNVDRFRPAEAPPEPHGRPAVVAIGAINRNNHDVKGQWVFAEVSKHVPEADFYLIGATDPAIAVSLQERGGPNLMIPGYMPGDEMLRLLQRARVACQLSWHESFGMGLVEAVSCGAAPVHAEKRIGAAVYLDNLAHRAPYGDIEATAEAIRGALDDARGPGYRQRAHDVIRRNIPLERRRDELLQVMAKA